MSGILNSLYNNSSFALRLHSNALTALQEQVYTGSRINRASDDPSTAYRILGLESEQKSIQNYLDNIAEICGTLEQSSTVLNEMAARTSEIKVNLTQVLSGTYGQGETGQAARGRLASEVDDILEHMVTLANSQYMGRYVFGGSNTNIAPYEAQRTNGKISGVTYQGSFVNSNIEVASGIESSAFYIGQDLFSSDNPDTPVFCGSSGAAAGSGTSNIKGSAWLTIADDGSGRYLSIDGGVPIYVADAPDITNIAVKNPAGEVLYVDATNMNAAGVEMVQVAGNNDLFKTLITIRDLLNNQNNLPQDTIVNLINNFSQPLEEVRSLLIEKQVSMGTKIGFLDDLKNSLEDVKFNAEDEATVLQEADIAQLSIDLSRREVLYQMSLSVTGKLMSMSLLDYI